MIREGDPVETVDLADTWTPATIVATPDQLGDGLFQVEFDDDHSLAHRTIDQIRPRNTGAPTMIPTWKTRVADAWYIWVAPCGLLTAIGVAGVLVVRLFR